MARSSTSPESPPLRDWLLQSVPAGWWPQQRWFGGKGRTIAQVVPLDATALPDEGGLLVLAEVRFRDGPAETYLLPLAERDARLADGLADAQLCRKLLHLLRDGRTLPGARGRFVFERLHAFDSIAGSLVDVARAPAISLLPPHQSNSLVRFDDKALLKCFRRVLAGLNPDLEVGRFLTQAGFANLPRLAGLIEYVEANGTRWPLAVLQAFVPNRGNAWELFLEQLRDYYEKAASQMPADGELLSAGFARQLGKRTGQMHVALASSTTDGAFAPEPVAAVDWKRWSETLAWELGETLALLGSRLDTLSPEARDAAQRVLAGEARLRERVQAAARLAGWQKIRIHGDYHLGQVLAAGEDFVIIDFEGEPLRPLEQRRAKQSALKDVAGMMRSFNYAAFAALFEVGPTYPNSAPQLEKARADWEREVRSACWQGYLQAVSVARVPLLPASEEEAQQVLHFFELEKALYEVRYEINNRPDWLRIPLSGIAELLR